MKKQLTGFLALLAALLLTVPAYADAIMPGPGEGARLFSFFMTRVRKNENKRFT